jgi:broad specificity phosphatase PhoE
MIIIRHAQKKHVNNSTCKFRLDSPITDSGALNAAEKCLELLSTEDIPTKIYCSPFLRTRQTAIIFQKVIMEIYGVYVELVIDINIGEFLGNQKNITKSDLTIDTLKYNPFLYETKNHFTHRLRTFMKYADNDSWYITHGLTLKTLAYLQGIIVAYPTELSHVTLNNNKKYLP